MYLGHGRLAGYVGHGRPAVCDQAVGGQLYVSRPREGSCVCRPWEASCMCLGRGRAAVYVGHGRPAVCV